MIRPVPSRGRKWTPNMIWRYGYSWILLNSGPSSLSVDLSKKEACAGAHWQIFIEAQDVNHCLRDRRLHLHMCLLPFRALHYTVQVNGCPK